MKRPDLTFDEQPHSRRAVVAAGAGVAAAAALAACATPNPAPAAPVDRPADAGRPANALARTADIPVGGGVIVGDTVITQPSPGSFLGLSSVCTHAGCELASVSGGTINCACHGSKFALDGSVANGPATKPLSPRNIRVDGDSVVVAR
ncbi:QcrA and Rieske domain-containing protein [Nocardia gipuzkoensis]